MEDMKELTAEEQVGILRHELEAARRRTKSAVP